MVLTLSFITVTHNRKDDLRRALRSIQMQDYPQMEIIVADNASNDGTAEMLAAEFPQVKHVRLKENYGAGGGRNRGVEVATGELLVFIDDDVEMQTRETARQIIGYFERYPDAGGFCFKSVSPETGEVDKQHTPRKDKKIPEDGQPCAMFIAGGSAFRRDVYHHLGGYWEKLGLYGGEEVDFSYRLINAGYSLRWADHIRVTHYQSPVSRPSWRKIYFATRNRPWITLRHLPWQYVMVSTFIWWGYLLQLAIKSGNLRYWLKGVRDNLRGIPEVMRQRKIISPAAVKYYKDYSGSLWW